MLRPLILAVMLVAPALPAAAQTAPAPAQQTQTLAAQYAQGMQGAVGQTFEGGIKIKAISAEANTLVITVDGPSNWRTGMTGDQISGALVGGFCQSAPQFFASGITMRVDSLDNGNPLKGPLVSACPPAPAAPAPAPKP